jgi:hypothetical protein
LLLLAVLAACVASCSAAFVGSKAPEFKAVAGEQRLHHVVSALAVADEQRSQQPASCTRVQGSGL